MLIWNLVTLSYEVTDSRNCYKIIPNFFSLFNLFTHSLIREGTQKLNRWLQIHSSLIINALTYFYDKFNSIGRKHTFLVPTFYRIARSTIEFWILFCEKFSTFYVTAGVKLSERTCDIILWYIWIYTVHYSKNVLSQVYYIHSTSHTINKYLLLTTFN